MRPFSAYLDTIRARLAAALLLALVTQFVGGEYLFARLEAARIEASRARQLADALMFANRFADARPDAVAQMSEGWAPHLEVRRAGRGTRLALSPEDADGLKVAQRIFAAHPELQADQVRLVRQGGALIGAMRLDSGAVLEFRSPRYFEHRWGWGHYAGGLILLLMCVALLALILSGAITRPLARISAAASRVGRDRPEPIMIEGPREVRAVATALAQMQARLLDNLAEREQSLAAISHDLRTPLARMRLNVSMVRDTDARRVLDADISEMEGFVRSVLDYLRGDAGDAGEAEQHADVASILLTLVDAARDRGEAISYTGPNRLETYTRPVQLKRIVQNLIENAGRYADHAVVQLARDGSTLTITIADDGPGIAESDIAEALQPFRRLETGRARHSGGVGLGLTIAHRLSVGLGGALLLKNREEGGFSVSVQLPIKDTADAR